MSLTVKKIVSRREKITWKSYATLALQRDTNSDVCVSEYKNILLRFLFSSESSRIWTPATGHVALRPPRRVVAFDA